MNAPVVTSLGHAGLRVDAPGLRLLCDPWLSPGGTFLGSWFTFPDNEHMRRPDVLDVDWVAVSHEHLDHLDLPLLATLAASVRIVIPKYPAPIMRNRIADAGLAQVVIELEPWRRLALNDRGDWITVIPEQSPMCHDAAILIWAAGHSVLHANDARLSVAQLRRVAAEVGGQIDLMGVQMSGASWHPICYEYPPDVRRQISAEKRNGKFKAVTRLLRSAPPRIAMPYAGPPCFLDPDLAHHNDSIPEPGVFPDQAQAMAFLEQRLPGQRCVSLLPGDRIDLESGQVERDPTWDGFSFSDVTDYLAAYADRRRAEIEQVHRCYPDPPAGSGLRERFVEHFERLGGLSGYFLRRIGMTMRFEVSGADGGTWDVSIGPDRLEVLPEPSDLPPQYRIRVAARWLEPVLAGRMHWEDLFLSLRISAWREPDIYNDYLMGLLKHADRAALDAVEQYETSRDVSATITVREGGSAWQISRYCTHAGEDLSEGAVVHDGVLRCLGHNFDFDLETGRCLNARCDPLLSREISATRVSTTRGRVSTTYG